MQFYSTIGKSPRTSLEDAVMRGLAPDGGLYMPEKIPVIPRAFFNNISDMSIQDISYVVANILLGDDIPAADLKEIVNDTFTFDVPLVKVDRDIYSLELFHGPTLAFKDVGARFLARIIGHFSRRGGHRKVNVLVATSGDSGGAVAAGFHNVEGVHVYVLYPSGTLSRMQERQFTSLGGNVTAIEVNGTFDDCQAMVKEAFVDRELREAMPLTSANSINIGRLLPQMFYYFHAYSRLRHGMEDPLAVPQVVMSVPCGNLGNLTAALMAKRMGLPVKRFIAANNINDSFTRFLNGEEFAPRRSVRTIANAMDVGNPSNLSRITDMYRDNPRSLMADVQGVSYDNEQIASAMLHAMSCHSYTLDPHGATAYQALLDNLRPGETGVFLETAHASKFATRVNDILGLSLKNPADSINMAPDAHRRNVKISHSYPALKNFLLTATR